MCGIVGFLALPSLSSTDGETILINMAKAIEARGPDDHGAWCDAERGVGLGHRRLAIVDLSPAGHQPMTSVSGRYVLVYNGEIYNHAQLRKDLESQGHFVDWRGHSDTETMLAGFDFWGVTSTLEKCQGMFAFGLWDRDTATLTLARDRAGEKPLYYGFLGTGPSRTLVFASELKALRAHPHFEGNINRDAITLLLRHNYVPAPYSIYQNVYKLPPASQIILSLSDVASQQAPQPIEYWSITGVVENGRADPYKGTPEQAVDDLDALLRSVVDQQMMADVPLGAFLSGGVDSSTIVALMQSQSARPIKTFTIGFEESRFNEAVFAKTVAQHLNTDHTELYVSAAQAMAVIPKLPHIYDEPFSDSSQIPTYLVSALAREHVTVSLSGDAGDELFAGYTRYQATSNVWQKLSRLPQPVRALASGAMASISPGRWNAVTDFAPPLKRRFGTNLGDKIHKAASVLGSVGIDQLYRGFVSHWPDPKRVVLGSNEPHTKLTRDWSSLGNLTDVEKMMLLDFMTYLPDDILTKVDRASMAVSLESRVPFLDHRVVEFAWTLPLNYKLREGEGKWVLKQVLDRYVPRQLIERPKMGFGVPIDEWLRGGLRDWAEALLTPDKLRSEGFFDVNQVRNKWQEHVAGERNWAYHLWDVIMFQAWLEGTNG